MNNDTYMYHSLLLIINMQSPQFWDLYLFEFASDFRQQSSEISGPDLDIPFPLHLIPISVTYFSPKFPRARCVSTITNDRTVHISCTD